MSLTTMLPATIVAFVVIVLAAAVLVGLFRWPGLLRGGGKAVVSPATPPGVPPTYPRALRAPTEGMYWATEYAEDGRLVRAHGLGRAGRVRVIMAAEGLVLDRQGVNDMLIGEHELLGAEDRGGRLVVRWQHDGVVLETIVELRSGEEVASWVESLERMGHE